MSTHRAPLERVGAIKLKLGALLVGGVAVTVGVLVAGIASGAPLWLAVVVAAGLALVTIDLLGTGLTAPLRQMAEQADRLADGLPVDEVDEASRDEVGALARAFNRMAREVAHTDRVRRELVANVSHELRTPLAAMSAVVENLVDGVAEPTPDRLEALEDQTGRLGRLVDQLLDLSSLDAGAVRLERRPTSAAGLVAEAVRACGPEATDLVDVRVEPAGLRLDVDPDRFAQVLVNLISNALRHGPDGEQVTVTITASGDAVMLVVADLGPGIAPADAERVFDRFARVDEGRGAADGGSGLGLSITRWIVTLHGGRVTVEQHDGPGARLRVELPAGVAAAGQPPDRTEDLLMDVSSPLPPPARPPAPTPMPGTTPAPLGAAAQEAGSGSAQLLPTPVAPLAPRALAAVAVAAVVAALLGIAAFAGGPGLGLTVLLGAVGIAALVARERSLDGFGQACVAIALGIVATSTWSDAAWVLVPATLVAVVVAGLGFWGPRRAGELLRAVVVGPLLTVVTPVAVARGVRLGRSHHVRRWVVPVVATAIVLLVFGGLLVEGDAAVAMIVDALLPDISFDATLLVRLVLAGIAAVAVVTYVLVQRAGTVPTGRWQRPVRPRDDWLIPVVTLDVLLLAAVAVRAGVLFGGEDRVLATTGLTYAEYARDGFGALLALAALVLVVVAVTTRVAADEHRTARDRSLGVLLATTGLVVVSAAQRLALYAGEFGLTRLRFSAAVAIAFVGVVLLLVAVAGRSTRVAKAFPRTLVLLVGATVLGVALLRPDAVIATQQVEAFGASDRLDTAYLTGLSADAAPAIATLPAGLLAAQWAEQLSTSERDQYWQSDGWLSQEWCGHAPNDETGWTAWNLSRSRAQGLVAEEPACTGARFD